MVRITQITRAACRAVASFRIAAIENRLRDGGVFLSFVGKSRLHLVRHRTDSSFGEPDASGKFFA